LVLNNEQYKQSCTRPIRQLEAREWWLWGFAVTVTLVLTAGIVSLTFPGNNLLGDSEWFDLKEWVRGLACLLLIFDIYTVYQQLQLQQIRRELNQRNHLFEVITENAADMIAVVDCAGNRLYNSPAYHKVLGYSSEELKLTSSVEQIHPEDQQRVLDGAEKARLTGQGERLEYRMRHKDRTWRIPEEFRRTDAGRDCRCSGAQLLQAANRVFTIGQHSTQEKRHHAGVNGESDIRYR
jgi:PAS domain S-box-containing protein